MSTGSAVRGRGRWPRSLVLGALLTVGTACGGSGDDRSSADVHRGAVTERPTQAPAAAQGQQSGRSASHGTGPGQATPLDAGTGWDRAAAVGAKAVPPPPPPPELAGQPPQAPPNTVSLDTLHRQGRTHVLR